MSHPANAKCVCDVLQISGDITYNGHSFDEFVPQRTSAYVNQYDEVLC